MSGIKDTQKISIEDEKIQKIDTKIEQLKAQKNTIIKRQKEKERKERTRRLIQNGALAEKYLNCENMLPAEFEKRLIDITNQLNILPQEDSKEIKKTTD